MKKITAMIVLAALLMLTLSACAPTVKGSYYSGDKSITKTYVEFDFSGKKVHITAFAGGSVVWRTDAEYEINDSETEIKITVPEDADTGAKAYSGEYSFERGEDYVKIGIIKYNKD